MGEEKRGDGREGEEGGGGEVRWLLFEVRGGRKGVRNMLMTTVLHFFFVVTVFLRERAETGRGTTTAPKSLGDSWW